MTTSTNDRGEYVVTPLNPVSTGWSFRARVFRPRLSAASIQVGQSARVDVDLKIGETRLDDRGRRGTPLLDTESGASRPRGDQHSDCQPATQRPQLLRAHARFTPGAALACGGNLLRIRANYISGTAISGVRGPKRRFSMDGIRHHRSSPGCSLIQTWSTLQKFKVQQSAYSAEFVFSAESSTRTTNRAPILHGGSLNSCNDKLDARDFFCLKESDCSATSSAQSAARWSFQSSMTDATDILLRQLRGNARAPGCSSTASCPRPR